MPFVKLNIVRISSVRIRNFLSYKVEKYRHMNVSYRHTGSVSKSVTILVFQMLKYYMLEIANMQIFNLDRPALFCMHCFLPKS